MTDWIVLNARRGGRLECLHCGQHYAYALPAPIPLFVAMTRAFEEMHGDCPRPAEGLRCLHCGEPGHEHATETQGPTP